MSRSYGRNLYIKNDSLSDIELHRDCVQLSVQNESKVMNVSGREETMVVADDGHKTRGERAEIHPRPLGKASRPQADFHETRASPIILCKKK